MTSAGIRPGPSEALPAQSQRPLKGFQGLGFWFALAMMPGLYGLPFTHPGTHWLYVTLIVGLGLALSILLSWPLARSSIGHGGGLLTRLRSVLGVDGARLATLIYCSGAFWWSAQIALEIAKWSRRLLIGALPQNWEQHAWMTTILKSHLDIADGIAWFTWLITAFLYFLVWWVARGGFVVVAHSVLMAAVTATALMILMFLFSLDPPGSLPWPPSATETLSSTKISTVIFGAWVLTLPFMLALPEWMSSVTPPKRWAMPTLAFLSPLLAMGVLLWSAWLVAASGDASTLAYRVPIADAGKVGGLALAIIAALWCVTHWMQVMPFMLGVMGAFCLSKTFSRQLSFQHAQSLSCVVGFSCVPLVAFSDAQFIGLEVWGLSLVPLWFLLIADEVFVRRAKAFRKATPSKWLRKLRLPDIRWSGFCALILAWAYMCAEHLDDMGFVGGIFKEGQSLLAQGSTLVALPAHLWRYLCAGGVAFFVFVALNLFWLPFLRVLGGAVGRCVATLRDQGWFRRITQSRKPARWASTKTKGPQEDTNPHFNYDIKP
jgi:hypothetical protein